MGCSDAVFLLAAVSDFSRSRSCMIGGNNCINSQHIRSKARISRDFRFGAQSAYRQAEFEKELITT
jgi:hypothetical protein